MSALESISWRRRSVGRNRVGGKDPGLRPRSDSTDNRVDLFIREHSTGALREGRHRGARDPHCGGMANHRIISDCEEDWITQRRRGSTLATVAVASRAVLSVEG